ncbi:forkhead box protein O1-like [Rhopalosiphum maidis]|uniref:forkhead box protein O1-like n=1 Tax=Rhopalosiphum maidis TaxID=43146 RepID=UPI000EFE5CD2|nr:forkhead box protein O1-like [Rhopalosiphum maidis]XP_026819878.1 forkhead box protein O1-like [Rhopalosiphum maidis]
MSLSSSSSTAVTQPSPLSDGLCSLVLSKRYLSCARPPHVYKLERENNLLDGGGGGGGGICEDSSAVAADCWPSTAWVSPPTASAAVHARYEPSDVFTPLVFEEMQPSPSPPSQMSMWLRPVERYNQPQSQPPPPPPPPSHHHVQSASGAGNTLQQRRPLQHLPPPAQSSLQPPAKTVSAAEPQNQNGNKPGDLSWLVNFQVASIFEPTCNGGTATGGNGAGPGVNVMDTEWPEPETLKQKKKSTKLDQKPSSKISRKPYRMPPSRLDKANKPGYTYTEMIHQALIEKKELPVAEIYQWISSHFPYFREDDERWKNSVRHNLSINPNFRKGRKSQGAGHYWRLCNIEESLGQREYSMATEDDTSSPQESSELEQACKYLEGELQRDSLEDVKMIQNINTELENEIYTNSFLISSPSKYVNEQISLSNNDFHSYSENLLEESIDFQYYNL